MSGTNQKRLIDYIPSWFPIVVAILAAVGATVRADTEIKALREDITESKQNSSTYPDRMARIETKLDVQSKSLERIERILDAR
jgi:hypothetical protein